MMHPSICSANFMQQIGNGCWIEFSPFEERILLVGNSYAEKVRVRGNYFFFERQWYFVNPKNPVAYCYWEENVLHFDYCVSYNKPRRKKVRWTDLTLLESPQEESDGMNTILDKFSNMTLQTQQKTNFQPILYVFYNFLKTIIWIILIVSSFSSDIILLLSSSTNLSSRS